MVKCGAQGWTRTSRCLENIEVGIQQRPVSSELGWDPVTRSRQWWVIMTQRYKLKLWFQAEVAGKGWSQKRGIQDDLQEA